METIKELRALCQGTAPAPQNESKLGKSTRFFSIYITRYLINTTITPNQITALSSLVFFVGICMFFSADYWVWLFGVAVVYFSVVMDGSDGEVARYRKNTRISGTVYVEPVSHDIQYGLMFIIIGAAWWVNTGNEVYFVYGTLASIFKLLFRLLETRYWFAFLDKTVTKESVLEQRYDQKKKPAHIRLVYWVNKNIFSSAGLVGPLFLAVLFKRMDLFLILYMCGYVVFFLLLFAKQVRKISGQQL